MSDFTQIHTFIEVAENGSFSEASRQLSLPRSTVSARIQALEKRLKVRLFNRNTRRVSLTNEGLEYLQQCRQALDLLRGTEEKFANVQRLSGNLRLTVPTAMPKHRLANILNDFGLQYPDLRIDVIVTDETMDLVAENIDVAIRGRAPGDLDLIARELEQTKVSYFSSSIFLESVKDNNPELLLAKHCIFELGKTEPATAQFTTSNFELALELAISHKGIVALPDTVCAEAVQSKKLIELEFPIKPDSLSVYLVYSARVHLATRVRALVEFIVAAYI